MARGRLNIYIYLRLLCTCYIRRPWWQRQERGVDSTFAFFNLPHLSRCNQWVISETSFKKGYMYSVIFLEVKGIGGRVKPRIKTNDVRRDRMNLTHSNNGRVLILSRSDSSIELLDSVYCTDENSDHILRTIASPPPFYERFYSSFRILKFSHWTLEC